MANSAEIINFPEKEMEEHQQRREVVKADVENGYYRVANEIGLALCRTHLNDSEGRIVHTVMLKTFGWNKMFDWVCYEQISELTGISVDNISKVKKRLVQRKIIIVDGKKVGINPIVSEWVFKSKQTQSKKNTTSTSRPLNKSKQTLEPIQADLKTSKSRPTQKKDTITKDTITKDTNVKSSKIPPDVIKDLFNKKLPVLGKVLKLNANRKTLINARQKDLPTLQCWEGYFEKISRSNFLTGISSNWKASFDWIIKDSNCLKILEGNYDNPAVSIPKSASGRTSVSEHNQQAMDEWLASKQPEIEVNPL